MTNHCMDRVTTCLIYAVGSHADGKASGASHFMINDL